MSQPTKNHAVANLLLPVPYLWPSMLAGSWMIQPALALWLWGHFACCRFLNPLLTGLTLLVLLSSGWLVGRHWKKHRFHWTLLLYPLPFFTGLGYLYLRFT